MARVSLDMSRTKRTGTLHTVPSGAERTICEWDYAGTTKITFHVFAPQVGDTRRALSSVPPEAPTPTPCQGDRVQSGGGGRLGLISIVFQLIVHVYLLLYMVVKLSRSSLPLADS